MNNTEEVLYEVAGSEVASKNLKLGLWAKAYSESGGKDNLATALYIKYRVEQLKQDLIDSNKIIASLPQATPSKNVLGSLGSFRYWLEQQDAKFKGASEKKINSILEIYRSKP